MSRKRREIKEINGILYMKCNKCGEFMAEHIPFRQSRIGLHRLSILDIRKFLERGEGIRRIFTSKH